MALLIVALMICIAVGSLDASRRLADCAVRPRPLFLVSLATFVVLAVGSVLVFGTTPLYSYEHVCSSRPAFAQFMILGRHSPTLIAPIIPPDTFHSTILLAPVRRAISAPWAAWTLLMAPFVWLACRGRRCLPFRLSASSSSGHWRTAIRCEGRRDRHPAHADLGRIHREGHEPLLERRPHDLEPALRVVADPRRAARHGAGRL